MPENRPRTPRTIEQIWGAIAGDSVKTDNVPGPIGEKVKVAEQEADPYELQLRSAVHKLLLAIRKEDIYHGDDAIVYHYVIVEFTDSGKNMSVILRDLARVLNVAMKDQVTVQDDLKKASPELKLQAYLHNLIEIAENEETESHDN